MDNGAVVQIWRGGFLDATPMWHERGDGSSRPRGAVQLLGKPDLFIQQLSSPQDVWKTNIAEAGFCTKGYELDENDLPTFHYIAFGKRISDRLRVLANGQGIQREVIVDGGDSLNGLFARLAVSSSIEDMGNGLYLLDDHSYYIQLDASDMGKAVIRNAGDKKELLLPVKNKLSYTLLL
jgi:hypothetical protein